MFGRSTRLVGVVGALALAHVGCASEEPVGPRSFTIPFAPRVGDSPFACGESYSGLGESNSTVEALDFRLYVHDVTLVRANGEGVPLSLEQDGVWQRDGIALLDFEDGTGACDTASPETRTVVVGSAMDPGDIVGLRFTLGIPDALNHLDAATAPAPLNVQGLWWTWQGGYKFARIDVKTEANPAFYFHLGATSCDGTVSAGFDCQFDNRSIIEIGGWSPDGGSVIVDLARLYAGSDLETLPDFQTDFVSGCMAFSQDPECPPMFATLGMAFESGAAAPGPQTLFFAE